VWAELAVLAHLIGWTMPSPDQPFAGDQGRDERVAGQLSVFTAPCRWPLDYQVAGHFGLIDDDGGGGAVDRGRRKHGGRPLVADASDELAMSWREGAGVGRECHGILLGSTWPTGSHAS
jgi:hypothetical protein